MALYQRIDDPTRTRELQCGDKFARDAGWIPYIKPAAPPKEVVAKVIESDENPTETPKTKPSAPAKPRGRKPTVKTKSKPNGN